MSILELQSCEARAVAGGPRCVGPADAVRLKKATGEVTGCVLHVAMQKALLVDVRFYPESVEGAAIAAFYLADEIDALYSDGDLMRQRAAWLIMAHAPGAAESALADVSPRGRR